MGVEARKKHPDARPDGLRYTAPKRLAGYRLRLDQIAALRREALRRAAERNSGKPDASELVRGAIDLWFAKAKR